MILESDFDNFYTPPFAIDVKDGYCWESVDYFDSLADALAHASQLTMTVREEWIRIIDFNNRII